MSYTCCIKNIFVRGFKQHLALEAERALPWTCLTDVSNWSLDGVQQCWGKSWARINFLNQTTLRLLSEPLQQDCHCANTLKRKMRLHFLKSVWTWPWSGVPPTWPLKVTPWQVKWKLSLTPGGSLTYCWAPTFHIFCFWIPKPSRCNGFIKSKHVIQTERCGSRVTLQLLSRLKTVCMYIYIYTHIYQKFLCRVVVFLV